MKDDDKVEFTTQHVELLAPFFESLNSRLDENLKGQASINSEHSRILAEMAVKIQTNEENISKLEYALNHHQQECVARTRIEDHIGNHEDIVGTKEIDQRIVRLEGRPKRKLEASSLKTAIITSVIGVVVAVAALIASVLIR